MDARSSHILDFVLNSALTQRCAWHVRLAVAATNAVASRFTDHGWLTRCAWQRDD